MTWEILGPVAMIAVISILAICYGSKKWLKVTEFEACFNEIPSEYNGLRILQISDLHADNESKMHINGLWETVAPIEYDFAVLTGDMVLNSIEELFPFKDFFIKLAEKSAVYYVEGNHERFFFKDMKEFLAGTGVSVLDNETAFYNFNGAEVPIYGLRDFLTLKKSSFNDLNIVDDDGNFKIVLQHMPQLFNDFSEHENILMMSGHTHGGQIRIPLLPTLYAPLQGFFPAYGYGVYTKNNNVLVVTKGIGVTDFPIRFYNRPEVVVVTVKVV